MLWAANLVPLLVPLYRDHITRTFELRRLRAQTAAFLFWLIKRFEGCNFAEKNVICCTHWTSDYPGKTYTRHFGDGFPHLTTVSLEVEFLRHVRGHN